MSRNQGAISARRCTASSLLAINKTGVSGRNSDNTLIKAKLGWEPKIQLKEGLTKTIEYFRGIMPKLDEFRAPTPNY